MFAFDMLRRMDPWADLSSGHRPRATSPGGAPLAQGGDGLAAEAAETYEPYDPEMAWGGAGAAQTTTSTTDPRLTYTAKAKAEGKGLDAKRLPYTDPKNPGAGMDHSEILSQLSQVDEDSGTATDEVRCGANSALAMAVLQGPEGIAKMTRQLDRAAIAVLYPRSGKISPARKAAVEAAYHDAGVAAFRVQEGIGTYADLSRIANAMKVIMTANPAGETKGSEAMAMAGLAAPTEEKSIPLQDPAHLESYARKLKPGETYMMHVDTDTFEGGTRTTGQLNHFVVLGREPDLPGKKGRVFVYDPYPREGSQMMYSNDPSFWTLFTNADDEMKSTYIVSRSGSGPAPTR